ncbi:unnamed protein product [Linum tenue]|uniref:Uncharacterized protein n=1 Tax=Linum tenue TaxID=586396 RepID=A0AAV0K742_9ROSI|nr:unnamed protein product [Linum tenue]
MVNQFLSATRGATDAFSGVSRHVNDALRKVGAMNIEVGVGCGIGFGHGFGVGIAVKPGVLQKVQACFLEAMTIVMMKLGEVPNMSAIQGGLPISLPGGIIVASGPTSNSPSTAITQLGGNFPDFSPQEQQKPFLREDDPALKQVAGSFQSVNNMLQMVPKHQQIIEELLEENKKLRQILVEDLKNIGSSYYCKYADVGSYS